MNQTTADQIDISAILSTYVYMDEQNKDYHNKSLSWILAHMPKETKATEEYKAVLKAVQENKKLGNMKLVSQSMCDGNDKTGELVIACTFQDPNGDIYVAYRGTGDGKWVDNGYGIANESSQMQREANAYFDQVVNDLGLTDYDSGKLIVTGHSKGGNEAQYVTLNSKYGYLVDNCYSIDGQGFSQEAIDHFIDTYGNDYYNAQLQKMYSINGENDYVHDLGIVVIPKENTYFITTPEASDMGAYHNILYMLDGAGLNWTIEGGYIISAEQGPIGQLAKAISEKMQYLSQEDLEDCAITIMSLLEFALPYPDENGNMITGGYYKIGSGDIKWMSGEEFLGFLAHGIPVLVETLLTTKEGNALLKDIIISGLSYIYNEAGFWGLYGTMMIASVVVPITVLIGGGLVLIGKMADWIYDFVDTIINVGKNMQKFFSDLKETIKSTINKIKSTLYSCSPGGWYSANHPNIILDTAQLQNYAQRLQSVNRRVTNLDSRLDSLYWKVGLLDLWNLMQADILTGYSWRLSRCASYLSDTATDFVNIENDLLSKAQ